MVFTLCSNLTLGLDQLPRCTGLISFHHALRPYHGNAYHSCHGHVSHPYHVLRPCHAQDIPQNIRQEIQALSPIPFPA